MYEVPAGIGTVISHFQFPRITRDQPDTQIVVPAGKIVLGIFNSVVEPAETIPLLSPGSEISVNRSYIRQRKNIPSFLHLDINIGDITTEFFQGYDNIVKKPCIDQMFAGLYKVLGQLLKC